MGWILNQSTLKSLLFLHSLVSHIFFSKLCLFALKKVIFIAFLIFLISSLCKIELLHLQLFRVITSVLNQTVVRI